MAEEAVDPSSAFSAILFLLKTQDIGDQVI